MELFILLFLFGIVMFSSDGHETKEYKKVVLGSNAVLFDFRGRCFT
jgi:hypothetical protein